MIMSGLIFFIFGPPRNVPKISQGENEFTEWYTRAKSQSRMRFEEKTLYLP